MLRTKRNPCAFPQTKKRCLTAVFQFPAAESSLAPKSERGRALVCAEMRIEAARFIREAMSSSRSRCGAMPSTFSTFQYMDSRACSGLFPTRAPHSLEAVVRMLFCLQIFISATEKSACDDGPLSLSLGSRFVRLRFARPSVLLPFHFRRCFCRNNLPKYVRRFRNQLVRKMTVK